MFNVNRSLLMNHTDSLRGSPMEELPWLDYRLRLVPEGLAEVRSLIFGQRPDLPMLQYRSRQLLTLCQQSLLKSLVAEPEEQRSYTWGQSRQEQIVRDNRFYPRVIANPQQVRIFFGGDPAAPDDLGKLSYKVDISISENNIEMTCYSAETTHHAVTADWSGQLSRRIPLGVLGYFVQVSQPAEPATVTVEGLLRPQLSLPELLKRLQNMSRTALLALFGDRQQEPNATFWTIWENEDLDVAERLSAVTAALITRTKEL